MNEKLYYMTCGFGLTFANLFLIETRFNLVGLGLGIAAAIFFIKALRIKK